MHQYLHQTKALRGNSRSYLEKALEIAENCEKVDTQLAAMATEVPGVKGREEDSANVNRIEDKKRGPGKNSHLTCYRCGRTG